MRLFPHRYEGIHPCFPERPEPLNANCHIPRIVLASTIMGGTIATFTKVFRKRPFATSFFNATGTCAAVWTVFNVLEAKFYHEMYMKEDVETEGFELKPRQWIQRTEKWTQDDCAIGGAVACLALSRIIPSPSFRRASLLGRYLAPTVVGSALGLISTPILVDMAAYKRARTRLDERKELTDKWLHATGTTSAFSWPFPGNSTPGGGSGQEGVTQVGIVVREPSLPPPGSHPHVIGIVDGETQPLPMTDYSWIPESEEKGMATLRDHIKEIQELREIRSREAEYLWIALAKKEVAMANEANPEKKDALMLELRLLGDIHYAFYQKVADCDWMIADSKKMIMQWKGGWSWQPEPRSEDVRQHSPEGVLKAIRHHLDGLKVTAHQLNGVHIPHSLPEDTRKALEEEVYEEIPKMISVTNNLLREYEELVDKAREVQHEEYKKSKGQ